MQQAGVTRDECAIGNTLRCLPPINKAGEYYPVGQAKTDAESHCRQYDLWDQYDKSVPLLLLGNHALSVRTGTDRISQWHGSISKVDGRLTGCSYHPSAVMRQPNLLPVTIADISNLLAASSDTRVLERPAVYKHQDYSAFDGPECVIDFEWADSKDGKYQAIDYDTGRYKPVTLTIIGTSTSGDKANSTYTDEGQLEAIKDYKGELQGHNIIDADFDVLDWQPESFRPGRVFDTKVVAHLIHAHLAELSLLSLGSLTRMYEPCENWKEDKDDALEYNGRDCAYNRRLVDYLKSDLTATGQWHLVEKQQRLAALAVRMRRRGIGISVSGPAISQFAADWTARREELKRGFPFNPNSPKQVLAWAAQESISLRDTTMDSIGVAARRTGSDILRRLAEYKDEGKPISTWFDEQAAATGFIYPSHSVTGTSVARFSSSGPNCQNIPLYLRHVIVPRSADLELVSFDFSNIENRTAAWIAGDTDALQLWSQGYDPYIATASLMFGCLYADVTVEQRVRAKTTELATLYGETEYNLAVRLYGSRTKEAVSQARQLQQAYFQARPLIKKWQQQITRQMDSGDITLRNPFGRVRYIYAQDSHNRMKRACHYLGCSTAADIVNQKALDIYEHTSAMPILIVHDELCYERQKGSAGAKLTKMIKEVLDEPVKEVGGQLFPYKQKAGSNYGEMKVG